MKFFVLICAAVVSFGAHAAVNLEFLAKASIPTDTKFKKTRIGGLSGVVYNPEKKLWIAVSDDRGRIQEPRFYELDLKLDRHGKEWSLKVDPKNVFFFHRKGEKRWKQNILDLEGVTILPWGNYLFSSEGDNNHKPRNPPLLLDVKPDGTWARDFSLPDDCLPEKSGVQTKGIQNNRGPEGLTATDDGHFIWVAIEGTLVQEREKHPNQIRIIQYEMPEAWIIKPTQSFYYQLEPAASDAILSEKGVSDIFWLKDKELLVMERALEVSMKNFGYDVKLFQVTLNEAGSLLKKEPVFDFKKLGFRLTNFEALAAGPVLPDGRKTLVVVSDNNFQKAEATEFWLFAIGSEKSHDGVETQARSR